MVGRKSPFGSTENFGHEKLKIKYVCERIYIFFKKIILK